MILFLTTSIPLQNTDQNYRTHHVNQQKSNKKGKKLPVIRGIQFKNCLLAVRTEELMGEGEDAGCFPSPRRALRIKEINSIDVILGEIEKIRGGDRVFVPKG